VRSKKLSGKRSLACFDEEGDEEDRGDLELCMLPVPIDVRICERGCKETEAESAECKTRSCQGGNRMDSPKCP
jgi:hypothetical protein